MPDFQVYAIDIVILVTYLALSRAIPIWLTRGKESTEDYFLGGRNFIWPLIGFSLFATNMSGSSFVGLAGAGYSQGISVYSYEWMASVILVIFIFFILPFYLRSGAFTMPQFLAMRFDGRSRLAFSGFNLFANVFIDCAAALYAGGIVLRAIFPGFPLWGFVLGLALLAMIGTFFGGLEAVVISDTIQAVVLIIGGTLIAILTFLAIPSWEAVRTAVPEGGLDIIQPIGDEALPWPGLLTGVLIIGIYFWCTNQLMVQRTLGAKTLDHGRWGSLFAGWLKLPILFIMILPGTMALALYPGLQNPDLVWPTLAFDLVPIGIRGIILAALVAAITSSVDSVLNSASTLVTMDFVQTLRPNTSQRSLVVIGRIATVIVTILAVIWAPQIINFPTLWTYLQSVLAYAVPPIVAVFLMGIFWNRANGSGCFWTLATMVPLGIAGFITSQIFGLFELQFLYASGILFVLSCLVVAAVSLATPPPSREVVEELTWKPALWRKETEELRGKKWYENYRIQSIILLVSTAVVVIWWW